MTDYIFENKDKTPLRKLNNEFYGVVCRAVDDDVHEVQFLSICGRVWESNRFGSPNPYNVYRVLSKTKVKPKSPLDIALESVNVFRRNAGDIEEDGQVVFLSEAQDIINKLAKSLGGDK